jgi:hypothetical protein
MLRIAYDMQRGSVGAGGVCTAGCVSPQAACDLSYAAVVERPVHRQYTGRFVAVRCACTCPCASAGYCKCAAHCLYGIAPQGLLQVAGTAVVAGGAGE